MAISSLYIIDNHGKIIINRNYRGDIPSSAPERYSFLVRPIVNILTSAPSFVEILRETEEKHLTPVIQEKGICYIYLKVNGLYIMGCSSRNADVISILCYLRKLIVVFENYFGEIKEETIRDNFVLLYELFDEMMDFGYPQLTDHKVLKEIITQQGNLMVEHAAKSVSTVTNSVSWRPEGIFYRRNEVFLDLIERVHCHIASDGTLLSSEILGTIEMKSNLSGMPELKLGLNDKLTVEANAQSGRNRTVELEDVRFHQCVRLSKFDLDRTISFIPPDGKFDLMSYRINANVPPLVWVEVASTRKSSRILYTVKVTAKFRSRSIANDVEIIVPVPSDVDTPSFKTSLGAARYKPDKDCMVWSIKQLYGGKEGVLNAQFGLPSIEKEEPEDLKARDVSVVFEIPYFTVSGIQVRYLKVIEKSGYQSFPWVRYITRNGNYTLKMR